MIDILRDFGFPVFVAVWMLYRDDRWLGRLEVLLSRLERRSICPFFDVYDSDQHEDVDDDEVR